MLTPQPPLPAVDEWIYRYPALVQFDAKNQFFRPMMKIVGRRLLGTVGWGVKLRSALGAGLSMMDMATDIWMIVLYLRSDDNMENTLGTMLLLFVSICLFAQVLYAAYINRRMRKTVILKEILIVLSTCKPGVDGEIHAHNAPFKAAISTPLTLTPNSLARRDGGGG